MLTDHVTMRGGGEAVAVSKRGLGAKGHGTGIVSGRHPARSLVCTPSVSYAAFF